MKNMKKLLALFLCLVMLLSLTACPASEDTEAPETTSNEELALEVYGQARTLLDSASNVTMDLVVTTLTNVDGDEFSEQSAQTLTYQAVGTEEAMIKLEEEISFDVHTPKEEDSEDDEDEEDESVEYSEIWYQDQLYVQLDKDYRYNGTMTKEDAAKRYTPCILLNEGNYENISCETVEGGTKITFAEAIAPESWAMKEEAQFESATGSAMIDATGNLTEMQYEITYTYGPAQITLTVESKPQATAKEIAVPEKLDKYIPLTSVEVVRLFINGAAMIAQADSMTVSGMESMVLDAAGIVSSNSYTVNMYGQKEDIIAKIEDFTRVVDYSSREEVVYDVEETYEDGKLTNVTNGGLPSVQNYDWEDMLYYVMGIIGEGMVEAEYLQDATITDLGSVYYIDFVMDENYGNTAQNELCESFWGDPSFLYNMASEYKNTQLKAYLSLDKYTGMLVAAGYQFEGVHTIKKQDYTMSLQCDQSFEVPSKGAYKEITGENLPEAEPENKATPLFYHVTGEDGQEMWLLGTIHVGDERTAYLPQEIKDAFAASDALALECNTELFDQQVEDDDKLAEKVSNLYVISKGKTLDEFLEEEDYQSACTMLKAVGGYNVNMPYIKPCAWSSAIEGFYMRQDYRLHGDQGVEERLMVWAEEQEKEILEVESNMAQLQMLTGFSMDLQLTMLMEVVMGDPQEYKDELWELYELWCAGDEEAMRQLLAEEADTSELTEEELAEYTALMEEYEKAMDIDRNKGMLKVAIEYLESDQVVFYAVGLAHLLDDTNGLVDTLRDAGYTVELVAYK